MKDDEIVFRDAISADISALAQLHVTAWHQTYEPIFGNTFPFPSYEIRKQQWQEKFSAQDKKVFCILAVYKGKLIGFASGNPYRSNELPEFKGELNKLYLLNNFKGRGIGKSLFKHACNRFIQNNISSMVAFTEPRKPNAGFFEHMGGKKLLDNQGEFHGAYGWFDLQLS